jgi:hypothetical protein
MQSAPKRLPNLPNFAQDQILVKMMQEGRNRGRRCRLESVLDILHSQALQMDVELLLLLLLRVWSPTTAVRCDCNTWRRFGSK